MYTTCGPATIGMSSEGGTSEAPTSPSHFQGKCRTRSTATALHRNSGLFRLTARALRISVGVATMCSFALSITPKKTPSCQRSLISARFFPNSTHEHASANGKRGWWNALPVTLCHGVVPS
eukprot:6491188-Amphidinium_carterae.1